MSNFNILVKFKIKKLKLNFLNILFFNGLFTINFKNMLLASMQIIDPSNKIDKIKIY